MNTSTRHPLYSRLLAVATALALGAAGDAVAQDSSNHIEGVRPEVHGNVGGYGSAGAGFRIDIPLVHHGLINTADDELALSLGSEIFFYNFVPDYYDGGLYLIPIAVLQWNFYVHPDWSLFPEAGLAFYVGPGDSPLRNDRQFYAAPAFSLGARYHFSPRNSLLLRASTPTGFQVGLTF